MEALKLLFGVGQVEAGAGPDVVDVPFALIVPGHALREHAFKVRHQLWDGAADKFRGLCSLADALSFEGVDHPDAQAYRDLTLGTSFADPLRAS